MARSRFFFKGILAFSITFATSIHEASRAYEFPKTYYAPGDIGTEPGWQVLADHFILSVETPGDTGTGFVIASPAPNLYILATAKHVIKDTASNEEIVLKDTRGNKHFLKGSDVIFSDPKYDLAFIRLKTKKCYLPVALTTTLNVKEKVTGLLVRVVGISSIDKDISDFPIARHARGEINTILPTGRGKQGYEIGYNAPTTRQMSGSPVFISYSSNRAGVVHIGAMHGKGERDEARMDAKSGYNFGVPSTYIYESAIRAGLQAKDLRNSFLFTENPMNTIFGSGEYAYRLSSLDEKNTKRLCSRTNSRMQK